jgi:hypothetical protein
LHQAMRSGRQSGGGPHRTNEGTSHNSRHNSRAHMAGNLLRQHQSMGTARFGPGGDVHHPFAVHHPRERDGDLQDHHLPVGGDRGGPGAARHADQGNHREEGRPQPRRNRRAHRQAQGAQQEHHRGRRNASMEPHRERGADRDGKVVPPSAHRGSHHPVLAHPHFLGLQFRRQLQHHRKANRGGVETHQEGMEQDVIGERKEPRQCPIHLRCSRTITGLVNGGCSKNRG